MICWVNCNERLGSIITFHITLAFENNECVASATAFLVANDSYTFNATKSFELPSEVTISCALVLKGAKRLAKFEIELLKEPVPVEKQTKFCMDLPQLEDHPGACLERRRMSSE